MSWLGCFWLLLHSVILVFFITPTQCRRLADVYWNSSNPIFDVSNTDHVLAVRLLDRLNIVCPLPDSRLSYEFSKLYAVSRDEYNTCTLGTSARLLGVCGNARQPSTISVVFRDFSPLPGAMEFRPGESYYVISTSDGLTEQGMDQRSGGLCMTKHMKLILEVQQSSSDEQRRAVSSSDHSPSPPSSIHDQPRTTPIMYLIHEDLSVQQQPFIKTTQEFGKRFDNVNDVYDFSKLDQHVALTEFMVKRSNALGSTKFLKDAMRYWKSVIFVKLQQCDNSTFTRNFAEIPKLLASFLLIDGDYLTALECLTDVIYLNDHDADARNLLLRWLLHLGQWELVAALIESFEHRRLTKDQQEIYSIMRLIVRLNVEDHHVEDTVAELLHKWNALSTAQKTFHTYQCQCLVRWSLAMAGKLPSSDLGLVGDPLESLNASLTKCQVLVRNRCDSFFDKTTSLTLQKHAGNVDDFMKLSSNVADYLEFSHIYMGECAVSGLNREVESSGINFWFHTYRLCCVPRLLVCVNSLAKLKYVTVYDNCRFTSYMAMACSLARVNDGRGFLSETEETYCFGLLKAKTSGKRQDERKDATIGSVESFVDNIAASFVSSPVTKQSISVSHAVNCECAECSSSSNSREFRMQTEYSSLLKAKFDVTSEQFHRFIGFYTSATDATRRTHTKICVQFGLSTILFRSPLSASDCYVEVVIRWLVAMQRNCGKQILSAVLNEALRVTDTQPLCLRSGWLHLRQLQRTSLALPDVDWIANPRRRRSLLSSFMQKFTALQIATTPKSALAKNRKDEEEETDDLQMAEKDFDQFKHLLYWEWRYSLTQWLARQSTDVWNAAYLWCESAALTIRQSARISLNCTFHYHTVDLFKRAIAELPKEITIIQLCLDENRVLWAIRASCSIDPLIVPIAFIDETDEILLRVSALLTESEGSVEHQQSISSYTKEEAKLFWQRRRRIDAKLQLLQKEIEKRWLGPFAAILLPNAICPKMDEHVVALCKEGFSEGASTFLCSTAHRISESDWQTLTERLAVIDHVDLVNANRKIRILYPKIFAIGFEWARRQSPTCSLMELASVPWEALSVFAADSLASRIPSLIFLDRLRQRTRQIPKSVDWRKSYYVLDPGGDLQETQKRLATTIAKYKWEGTVGAPPSAAHIRTILENKELFLYFGHGSGNRYFGRSAVRQSDCRAVTMLMGCSSVRIVHEGPRGLDGRTAVFEYMIASCPCLVGCLWMVTDGEIDRFFMALLDWWLSKDQENPRRQLLEAIRQARKACKLPNLTGSAVVTYGLPIISELFD